MSEEERNSKKSNLATYRIFRREDFDFGGSLADASLSLFQDFSVAASILSCEIIHFILQPPHDVIVFNF